MARVVFVEILGRRGSVKERVRIDTFPAAIGRAYTNDVIIGDRFVCPEHLRVIIDEEGVLVVEDLGSVNGLFELSPSRRVSRTPILPEKTIRVGHTLLRFRTSLHHVGPTSADAPGKKSFERIFESGAAKYGIFFLCLVLLIVSLFLGSYHKLTAAKLLGSAIPSLILFAIWSGAWSFINRLVTHEFRFLSHLSVISATTVFFIILKTVSEYYAFLCSPGVSLEVARFMGLGLLAAFLFYGHTSIISAAMPARRSILSILISLCVVGIIGFFSYMDRSEFTTSIDFPSELKPIHPRWMSTISSEKFFEVSRELKEKVDALGSGQK